MQLFSNYKTHVLIIPNLSYRIGFVFRLSAAIVAVCIAAVASASPVRPEVDSLLNRGLELTASTAYAAALECNLQALDIVKRTGQDEKLPTIYMHIGNIFSHINDLETARSYYLRALPLTNGEAGDRTTVGLLTNLFYVSFLQNQPDSAAYYLRKLECLNPTTPRARYDLIFNHGLLHELQGRPDSALMYYHRAAVLSRTGVKSQLNEAAANSAIADLYMNLNDMDSALKYYRLNERLARDYNHMDLLVESLRRMAEVHDRNGDVESALRCKSEYLALSDSILSRDEISKIKNTQNAYEQEGNADTIRTLNLTNALQRNWILSLTIFIAVVLAFTVMIWIQKRRLSRAYSDLYRHNSDELNAEMKYREHIAELEAQMAGSTQGNATQDTGSEGNDQEAAPSEPERRLLQNKEQRATIMARILREFENSEDYCRSDYSIEMLANAVGSNARYVSEAINEEHGMNFRSLLNEFRIKRSMQMLDDFEHYGHLTIKAISESVGYKSHSTFINVFVRQTGLKPSLYQSLSRSRKP